MSRDAVLDILDGGANRNHQRVLDAYRGSSGEATKAIFAELVHFGADGSLAIELYRAQKASERAKVYRGGARGRGSYKGMAYDKKQWAMGNLCKALNAIGDGRYPWGWGTDEKQEVHRHVLYIDLPTGQVSFHTENRGEGPDYGKPWDGHPGESPGRICRFIADVLNSAINSTAEISTRQLYTQEQLREADEELLQDLRSELRGAIHHAERRRVQADIDRIIARRGEGFTP